MASKIKLAGGAGRMLQAMADRGGQMTTDYRGFPPSRTMFPLRRRGLAELRRTGLRLCRYNLWHLTEKGWAAIGRTPPVAVEG